MVAAGIACYVADPPIDTKERVRRAVNIELESATEMMRLLQVRYPEQLERYDQRRREIVKGARRPRTLRRALLAFLRQEHAEYHELGYAAALQSLGFLGLHQPTN